MATPKQQALIEKIAENVRSSNPQPLRKLMKQVGYSQGMADHPSRIVKTANFIELLEKNGVTDKRITTVIKNGLFAMNGRKVDHNVRYRFVDLACKLKGHLKEADNGGLESIAALVENLKGVDVQVLLMIKSKLHASEPIDV